MILKLKDNYQHLFWAFMMTLTDITSFTFYGVHCSLLLLEKEYRDSGPLEFYNRLRTGTNKLRNKAVLALKVLSRLDEGMRRLSYALETEKVLGKLDEGMRRLNYVLETERAEM
jgi:hypothetical protein